MQVYSKAKTLLSMIPCSQWTFLFAIAFAVHRSLWLVGVLNPWVVYQNKPQTAWKIKISGRNYYPCRVSLKEIISLHTTQLNFTGLVDPVQGRRRISNWVAPTSRTNTASWTHVTASLPWYHVRAPSAILTENRSWSPPSSKLGHESSLEKVTCSDSTILLKVSLYRKRSLVNSYFR